MHHHKPTTEQLTHMGARAQAIAMAGLIAAACGSAAVPNAEFADAKASLGAAQASGAQDVPEASLYLKMATDGIAAAETQMEKEQNEDAAMTLQRAKADAELARSLATKAKAQADADVALKRIETLQQQNAPQT